ncbi:MAG: response regulator [Saprospiraceae bacterium]
MSYYPVNILVAEDHIINQKIILFLLRKAGYDVDIVDNGKEAIDAVLEKRYDIVFMDVQMPEIDGIEATRIIRELLPVQEQPTIIALTANEMYEDRIACLNAGMQGYITKPIQANIIYSVIEKYKKELIDKKKLGLSE